MSDSDINTQKTIALFDAIRDQLSQFEDDKDIGGIEKTHIMFDVLEQLLARVIASSAMDSKNLAELVGQTNDNLKAMAEEFFADAEKDGDE